VKKTFCKQSHKCTKHCANDSDSDSNYETAIMTTVREVASQIAQGN
jgi:hypothetical protein